MRILIVGCERSGTTVIAKLLSKGCSLSLLNDPQDSWYIYPLVNIVGIKGFTLSIIYRIWKYKIVKVPGFATILPQLKKVHPKPFKIIYMVRDPRDNYSAIKERLDKDLNGLYVNIHFLNKKGKNICENISYRWKAYLESALKYSAKNENQILFIRYEDFLMDKVGTLKKIADFASLKFDEQKILNDIDNQLNKSWSNKIKGEGRYNEDLTKKEIETIEKVTEKEMIKFQYLK